MHYLRILALFTFIKYTAIHRRNSIFRSPLGIRKFNKLLGQEEIRSGLSSDNIVEKVKSRI